MGIRYYMHTRHFQIMLVDWEAEGHRMNAAIVKKFLSC